MVTTLPRGTGDITRTCTVRHICKAVHTPTRYTRIRANRDPVACTCAPAALAVLVVSRRRVRSEKKCEENTAVARSNYTVRKKARHYICSAGLFGPLASLCLYLSRSAPARAHLSACRVACCVSRAKSPSLSLSLSPSVSICNPAHLCTHSRKRAPRVSTAAASGRAPSLTPSSATARKPVGSRRSHEARFGKSSDLDQAHLQGGKHKAIRRRAAL